MNRSLLNWKVAAAAMFFLPALNASAYDFNYENLLIGYLKLNHSVTGENIVDDYMKLYRTKVWQASHNDEFEFKSKEDETLSVIQKRVSDLDLNKSFTVLTGAEFKTYDFNKGEFVFHPFDSKNYLSSNLYDCCYKTLPQEFRVFFDNSELVDGLRMSKDDASAFLKKRKNQAGQVNRNVYVKIDFVLKKASDDGVLIGHMEHVAVYNKQSSQEQPLQVY